MKKKYNCVVFPVAFSREKRMQDDSRRSSTPFVAGRRKMRDFITRPAHPETRLHLSEIYHDSQHS